MTMPQAKPRLKAIGSLADITNLDEFYTEILSNPIANITKFAKIIEVKLIKQELNLTKVEIMERDNQKKLIQGGLRIVF